MSPNIQDQLRRAYQLILEEQYEPALAILTPICKADPTNANAWWLVANALQDPERRKLALKKVLSINPQHAQALARLQELQYRPVNAPLASRQAPTTSNRSGLWPIGIIIGLLVLISVGAAAAILMGQDDSADSQVAMPSLAASQPQIGANQPINSPTPLPAASDLPATWTPSPAPTREIRPTLTPWWESAPLATADPALFGETYWDGLGDGMTMETMTRSEGRHLRFIDMPVKVWMSRMSDPVWVAALTNAINEISQIVPLEVVELESQADMTLYIEDSFDYRRIQPCQAEDARVETLGCNIGPINFGDVVGGDQYHRIISIAYVNADTTNPDGVVLHEMLHAMGIIVHSPYEDDIMYPYENGRTTLSQRDINTLARLYANPSYAD
jgi:hypothetical protein